MSLTLTLLAGLTLWPGFPPGSSGLDVPQLGELLRDRQDPRGQSQAALLLVQSTNASAEKMVRKGLRQADNEEMFLALAAAVRLRQDPRFTDDLLAALTANRPRLRQVIAETLAVLPDPGLVRRLTIVIKGKHDLRVRQTAIWTLGRCGHKAAAAVLIEQLDSDEDDIRRVALSALGELTGQAHGTDRAKWKTWWDQNKNMTNEKWLQMRLGYQASRAQRLEGELQRARAQVLRLQQQFYNRLPVAERFVHLQSLVEHEDPNVRGLAVVWSVELMTAADATRKKVLGEILLRLSKDNHLDVKRGALLGLGRIDTPAAYERLRGQLKSSIPGVRAAAARALAFQACGKDAGAKAKLKQVIKLLQGALEDKALEVVIEAGESLGMLGVPEAGPVLTGLLTHRSEHVRRTAAQALERVADVTVFEGLLKGLTDTSGTVRFSLVGALSRAASCKPGLKAEQQARLIKELERLLDKDADQGVRSRAATVLGECGTASCLANLWKRVQNEQGDKVQEKTWDALVEIIIRAGDPDLLEKWDETVTKAKQEARRVSLLAKVYSRWEQIPEKRSAAGKALERLIQAHLDQGKWATATPLIQGLLTRTVEIEDTQRTRCLRWLLQAGELALKAGNRAEALRCVQDARGYLKKGEKLTASFDALQNQAAKK